MLEIKFGYNWEYKGHRGKETLFPTAIGSFITAMRDWAPAFRLIAEEVFEPLVRRQFETFGAAFGAPWQKLADSTIARKGSSMILSDTGHLEDSFRKGGSEHVEDITGQTLRWGSTVPYALFHQTGTGKGFQRTSVLTGPGTGRGMAMRKILSLSAEQIKRMRSVFVGRLAQIARIEGYRAFGAVAGDPLLARRMGQRVLGL